MKNLAHLAIATAAAAALPVGGLAVAASGSADGLDDFAVFEAEASPIVTQFSLSGPGQPVEGFNIGDLFLEYKPLVDPATGDDVGTVVTRYQILDVTDDDPVFNLDCTVDLAAGDIVFYGAGRFSELAAGAVFALTGGTGDYTGASGTVSITADELDGEPGFTIAFDFL